MVVCDSFPADPFEAEGDHDEFFQAEQAVSPFELFAVLLDLFFAGPQFPLDRPYTIYIRFGKLSSPIPGNSIIVQTDDFELDKQVENSGVPFVGSDDHSKIGVSLVDLRFRIHDEDDVVAEWRQMYKVPMYKECIKCLSLFLSIGTNNSFTN